VAELTFENLLKHLDRYGPDGVMDTARDAGISFAKLCELQIAIDRRTPRVKHRKTVEARVRSWLGLPEEEAAA